MSFKLYYNVYIIQGGTEPTDDFCGAINNKQYNLEISSLINLN